MTVQEAIDWFGKQLSSDGYVQMEEGEAKLECLQSYARDAASRISETTEGAAYAIEVALENEQMSPESKERGRKILSVL